MLSLCMQTSVFHEVWLARIVFIFLINPPTQSSVALIKETPIQMFKYNTGYVIQLQKVWKCLIFFSFLNWQYKYLS